MDFKRVGIVVGLIVVIVIAAVFTARHTTRSVVSQKVQAEREKQQGVKLDKIDTKTLEVVSATEAEWNGKYAPDSSGHFKNPKTGEYTVANLVTCVSCGAPIPALDPPPSLMTGRGTARMQAMQEYAQLKLDYKCPKCGKNAYSETEATEK